jgi:predicted Mrr-cat superfamily restriction endonuclease
MCSRHPDGTNKGRHKLYESGEKEKYTCKYCGVSQSSISSLTSSMCSRHPAGSFKGRHVPALIALNTYKGEKNMSVWLHRISHFAEISHPLLDRGYLSIGWSDFSNKDFVEQAREGNKEYFEAAFDKEWGNRPRSRWSLWKYLAEMKTGDIVVVPGWGDFSVYRIVGDRPITTAELPDDLTDWNGKAVWRNSKGYLCHGSVEKEDEVDLGFFWRVELVQAKISRDLYADQSFTSRMKVRNTTVCLNDIHVSVQAAIERFSENKPISLHSSILEASQENVLAMIRKELNPDKFEKLVVWYFRRVGATTADIPAKNESGKIGDADIVATFEGIKTIIYVQAKHHTGETSSWALAQIKDYVHQKDGIDDGYIKIAWVISSADGYSEECRKLAQENHVLLVNGHEFAKMLLEAGIANLDEALI